MKSLVRSLILVKPVPTIDLWQRGSALKWSALDRSDPNRVGTSTGPKWSRWDQIRSRYGPLRSPPPAAESRSTSDHFAVAHNSRYLLRGGRKGRTDPSTPCPRSASLWSIQMPLQVAKRLVPSRRTSLLNLATSGCAAQSTCGWSLAGVLDTHACVQVGRTVESEVALLSKIDRLDNINIFT